MLGCRLSDIDNNSIEVSIPKYMVKNDVFMYS